MQSVNIFEAKTNLSKLLEAIESGKETEIIIARNGKPVARLVSIDIPPVTKRLGVARGKFTLPDTFEDDNEIIQSLFTEA